jgi:dTDP-4-amino-4,6-dideoxygalactose transaminase
MPEKGKGNRMFPAWPAWDEEDVAAVTAAVRSGSWWCGAPGERVGENLWEFQKEFARFQEAGHCIAVANGTVAIETALLALGIGMGDEVIVSDYTFVASASAVVAVNAVPVFCDIRADTLVMDVDKVEPLITPRTRAIIAVHLGGNPVAMDRLCEIASRHGLKLIEDCAHAQGSRYLGKRVGNWGDAGTFSFQASKVLTAGEGGAVVCNDDGLAERIYGISDCGRRSGDYFYAHHEYGANYRMSEFLAALLRSQLKKFPGQHVCRNENARLLRSMLDAIDGVTVMKPTDGAQELGYYIYPFLLEPSKVGGKGKQRLERALREGGIPTDDCYPPLHRLGCFRDVRLRKGMDYSGANWGGGKSDDARFPVVSDVYERSIQLPHYVLLADRGGLEYIAERVSGCTAV